MNGQSQENNIPLEIELILLSVLVSRGIIISWSFALGISERHAGNCLTENRGTSLPVHST